MIYEMQKRVNIEQKCGKMEALPICLSLPYTFEQEIDTDSYHCS